MECSNVNSSKFWSYDEAKRKCSERYSCFVETKAMEHMSLSPYYIGRIKKGVQEEIERKIHRWKFLEEYQGIIVAYSNLKLLQNAAEIFEDTPLLHFDIQVNYVIFKPEVGKKLVGVVNKMSSSHVGCLVHGRFNASLAKPRSFKNGWIGSNLAVGTQFVFRVANLQSVAGVLSINGEIKEKDVKHFRHAQSMPPEEPSQLDISGNSIEQIDSEKKIKKRKKKDREANKSLSKVEYDKSSLEDAVSSHNCTLENSRREVNISERKAKTKVVKYEKNHDNYIEFGRDDKNNNIKNRTATSDKAGSDSFEKRHTDEKKQTKSKEKYNETYNKVDIKMEENSSENSSEKTERKLKRKHLFEKEIEKKKKKRNDL